MLIGSLYESGLSCSLIFTLFDLSRAFGCFSSAFVSPIGMALYLPRVHKSNMIRAKPHR